MRARCCLSRGDVLRKETAESQPYTKRQRHRLTHSETLCGIVYTCATASSKAFVLVSTRSVTIISIILQAVGLIEFLKPMNSTTTRM